MEEQSQFSSRITDEVKPYLEDFLNRMKNGEPMTSENSLMRFSAFLSEEAMRLTAVLNSGYHEPKVVRQLFSILIGKKVDKQFKLHPPFYTDCGRNITVGKRVFINSGCTFQDQGGITIGDDTQIGHNVILVTLNHDKNPLERRKIYPSPIKIGKCVWIGSGAIILPGVTVGDGAIIGAGSVVTHDVAENTTVAGNPARILPSPNLVVPTRFV